MKKLFIKRIQKSEEVKLEKAEQVLESQTELIQVDTINWQAFPYCPSIGFRIAHTNTEILLKYYVTENHILAQETNTNGDVYKDSCVEFFISLDEKNYYNFEFNCIGTIHIGYGPGRGNRTPIKPSLANKIEIKSSLGNQPINTKKENQSWEMMIKIPLDCFAFDNLEGLEKIKASGNFYKCGDETNKPHFVTWNPIGTDNPDYHCPEYFGKLEFE